MAFEDTVLSDQRLERRADQNDRREPGPQCPGAGGDVPSSTRVLPCPHNRQRYTPNSSLTSSLPDDYLTIHTRVQRTRVGKIADG